MLTRALIWIPTAIVVAIAMEFWAALLHGRVWHRILWPVHRSHHIPRRGRFEDNDWLSTLHAPIAIAFILYGCRGTPGIAREAIFGTGIGMSIFGVAYFVCHDGLVHGRLPVAFLARIPWLARVCDAHRVHHKRNAVPHGFFSGPWVLATLARKKLNAQTRPRVPRATPNGRAPAHRARATLRRTPPDGAAPSNEGTT